MSTFHSSNPFSDPSPTAASTFWGPLLSPSGAASPVFHRFLTALFTHYDGSSPPCNTNALENGKMCTIDEAMGDPPTENAILVIDNWLKPQGGSRSDLDSATVILYQVFKIPFVMSTRRSEPPVWDGMPVVPYEGFVEWQVQRLSQEPRRYWKGMNGVLAAGLVDVETGVEFTDTAVSWDCFPQDPVAELVQRDAEMAKAFWREFETWFNALVEKRKMEELSRVLALQAQMVSQEAMAQSMRMMYGSSIAAQRSQNEALRLANGAILQGFINVKNSIQ